MDLILSHVNTDFDAASAMVAASKLYPGAELGLSGSLNRNVREFFALYLKRVRFLRAREIDLASIERLIVVDTQDVDRLGRFAQVARRQGVKKVFGAHRPPRTDLAGDPDVELSVESGGSTATLLVRRLLRMKIPISPIEATLFCTGIYEDTGCLLFGCTTRTDIKTVFDLTGIGADLSLVANYVGRGLNPEQRRVLEELMSTLSIHSVGGFEIGVASACRETYMEDLDAVVGKLREIEDLKVVFVAVGMGRHTYLIGRSRFPEVPVGKMLAELGGGGHAYAASAVLHMTRPEAAVSRLLAVLQRRVAPQSTARQIMSTPVKTVPADTTIASARLIMSGFGYGSLPVVDGDRVVGIASRADMERAERHGLGHARLTTYMTRDPIVIAPDTPVLEIQHSMIVHHISSLPVVDDGRLLGIVTAHDVLRALHKSFAHVRGGRRPHRPRPPDCKMLMERAFPPERLEFMKTVGTVGDEQGLNCYLVGGTVRDLLLGRRNVDLDVVVERDAHCLARALHERLGGRLQLYERYRTATLASRGTRLDLATTRREYYEFPAARPHVDTQNVRLDLYRRDFTINAMAMGLNQGQFGRLFDYYDGYRDLLDRRIRVLHNLSFVDDPTRVFRALRFAGRLEFDLETRTASFLQEALNTGMLDKLSREVLFAELSDCLKEAAVSRIVGLLAGKGVFRCLATSLDPTEETLARVLLADRLINDTERVVPAIKDRGYPFFFHLFLDLPAKREVSCARFLVPRKYQEWAASAEVDRETLERLAASDLEDLLKSHFVPARALALAVVLPEEARARVVAAIGKTRPREAPVGA